MVQRLRRRGRLEDLQSYQLEDEVIAPESMQIDSTTPPEQAPTSNDRTNVTTQRRVRGRTRLEQYWTMDPNGPKRYVKDNRSGQPSNKEGGKLSKFLGTMVRKPRFFPLRYAHWKHVPGEHKKGIWKNVQDRFDVGGMTRWVMQNFSKKWRDYKSHLKTTYYLDYMGNPDECKKHCPREVDKSNWDWLVDFWESETGKMRAVKNKANRGKQKMPHTSGTKSFARRREEMKEKTGVEPSRVQLFIETHTRKDGTAIDPESAEAISKMKEKVLLQQENSQDPIARDDIFSQVIGPDLRGHVRMMGLGVTPNTLWGRESTRQQYMEQVAEAHRLVDEACSHAEDARREAAEANRRADEACHRADERTTHLEMKMSSQMQALVSFLGRQLNCPMDMDAILHAMQVPSGNPHSAPDDSGDDLF